MTQDKEIEKRKKIVAALAAEAFVKKNKTPITKKAPEDLYSIVNKTNVEKPEPPMLPERRISAERAKELIIGEFSLTGPLGKLLKMDTKDIVKDIKRNMTKEELKEIQNQISSLTQDPENSKAIESLNHTFPERTLAKMKDIGNELSKSDKPLSSLLDKVNKTLNSGLHTFAKAFKKVSEKKEIDSIPLKEACKEFKTILEKAKEITNNRQASSDLAKEAAAKTNNRISVKEPDYATIEEVKISSQKPQRKIPPPILPRNKSKTTGRQ